MAQVISIRYKDGRSVACCYHSATGYHEVSVDDTTVVNLNALGWGFRDGRWPICPEHRVPSDEPLPVLSTQT